jgi:hypothetical protein
MKNPSDLKKRLQQGVIRRASRDRQLADEWVSLEDTLSPEEARVVRKGESQLKCGTHVHWKDVKKTSSAGLA